MKIMLRNLRSNINSATAQCAVKAPATAYCAVKALDVVQKVCSQFITESDATDN